jgi:hypothetical protein
MSRRTPGRPDRPDAPGSALAAGPAARGGGPTLGLAQALERSEPLAVLLRRLQQARALFETIAPLLPAGLHADVRPGPMDGSVWTLLAAHNPAAAKLRQLTPLLLQRLQETGWEGSAIKVRVQPPTAAMAPSAAKRMP